MTVSIFTNNDRIDRFLRFYIHHKALYSKGWGELGFIRNLFSPNTLMVGWLFLKSFFPHTPYWVLFIIIPMCVLCELGIGWSLGYWWDKQKAFQKEADWHIKRNAALKGVTDELLKDVEIKGY